MNKYIKSHNRKKHNILKYLNEKDIRHLYYPLEVYDPIISSAEISEIAKDMKLDIQEADLLCGFLNNTGLIEYAQTPDPEDTYCYITRKGKFALLDKTFLKKIWYYSRDFWLKVIPIIISTTALIWSMMIGLKNNSLQKQINQQEQQIQRLEVKH